LSQNKPLMWLSADTFQCIQCEKRIWLVRFTIRPLYTPVTETQSAPARSTEHDLIRSTTSVLINMRFWYMPLRRVSNIHMVIWLHNGHSMSEVTILTKKSAEITMKITNKIQYIGKFIIPSRLYMFRAIFSPIIRSTWLYLQYLIMFSQQRCYHHVLTVKPEAVNAVVCSWR
jgi:hypothetical protein